MPFFLEVAAKVLEHQSFLKLYRCVESEGRSEKHSYNIIHYLHNFNYFFFLRISSDNLFHQNLALSSYLYDFWQPGRLSAINNC